MQAARGTSLSSGTQPGSGQPLHQPILRHKRVFWAIASTAYGLDLGSKILAVHLLSGGNDVPLIGAWFSLSLTRNPGAAFSTGTQFTVVLTCLAIAAVATVLYVARRVASTGWAVALGLLLAGISGNLTDRIFRAPGPMQGHVVDFFRLPHWPIFNVADICIDVAAALIVLMSLRGIGVDGRRHDREQEPA